MKDQKIYTALQIGALVIHLDYTTAYNDRQKIEVPLNAMASTTINHLDHFKNWSNNFISSYGDGFTLESRNGNDYKFKSISEKLEKEVADRFTNMSWK